MNFKAYEVIDSHKIAELNSESFLLRHKKTGARVALISNDDPNKVFYIGFRTPPTDSTGVAHILEHSVLCGSKQFPVKDPFVELAKSSLNTFLNAMTYPDKTVYPVASCNDADFQNLLHVYLDAVFYPNIYNEKKIFMQEGWHYELAQLEEELKLNGVVYNEMKGAFSSPDDVHERCIMNSLFPESPYGVESGGDPDVIPELTYENFLDFHSKYYHPSNSYIYLYGDMDMEEKLEWIDENYLSNFDKIDIDSTIALQQAFDKPVDYLREYPITDEEAVEDATYLSLNTVVADSLDPELYVAFQVLDYALCSAPGAPLYEALLDNNIGKEVYSLYENGIAQPYFSIVAKQANSADKENFKTIIYDTLRSICEKGMNKKSLKAALNYFEFKYKEADFGSYPKGLMYGLQIMDSWLYDETKPFIHLEANATFESLKKKADTDYFESLIEKYLLNNTHVSLVEVRPQKGLTAKKDALLKQKLADYRASLGENELKAIIEDTKALDEYHTTKDLPEDLAKLPMLKRSDIKKEAEPFVNELVTKDDCDILVHDIFTNGIAYIKLLFDINNLPARLTGPLGLYKTLCGIVNTQNYSYGDLYNEVNLHTGGMSSNIGIYTDNNNPKVVSARFEIKVRTLNENIDKAFSLTEEIMYRSILEDAKRLKEIIGEAKSHAQAHFMAAGHSLSMLRAASNFAPGAALSEAVSGIEYYRYLDSLDVNFDEMYEGLVRDLREVEAFICNEAKLLVDFTGDKSFVDCIVQNVKALKSKGVKSDQKTSQQATIADVYGPKKQAVSKKEGFTNSAQVQYVARCGNFRYKGLPYDGALRVLKVMMGYDYLWNQVRVKGGAYGCMSGFGRSGDSFFVSYRDPNLKKTLDVYEGAASYIRNIELDERALTGYVIGAFSEMDMPLTPQTKGLRSMSAYLTGLTEEDVQKERDQVLLVTNQDIQRMADYIEAFLDFDIMCTVGNEEKINEEKDLFTSIESLM